MQDFVCEQCQKAFQAEELPRRGEVCFACHVRTIRLGFTYGKEDFHGPTIRERQAKTVSDAKINGYNAEPVGSRWV
jgi:cytochrome c5